MKITAKDLRRWFNLLATYFVGQGSAQVLQLICGFLIINWLDKESYATFALVVAILSTTNILVEFGITQSMGALIGKRIREPATTGRYIAACQSLRNWTFGFGAIVLFFVIFAIGPRYGWGGGLWAILWGIVILTMAANLIGAVYSPVFLLRQEIRTHYGIMASAGTLRLVLILLAKVTGIFTAPVALLLGAIQGFAEAIPRRRLARRHIESPGRGDDLQVERKEILSQALPRLPGFAFYSVESQIKIFLVGFLGTTAAIAEVGALGRLAMLFIILNKIGGVLISPHFAKLDQPQVAKRSLLVFVIATVIGSTIATLVYLFPGALLILLGDGYQHLRYEVFLAVCASCVRLIDVYAFSICVARKYIFAWYSIADIGPLLVVMGVAIAFFDLSSVTNVLYFGLVMISVRVVTKLSVLLYGLRYESRAAAEG